MSSHSAEPQSIRSVPLVAVEVSARNARKNLAAGTEDADVAELAASIEVQGLLNPPFCVRSPLDATR